MADVGRKLAAILSADVVAYSRLMAEDEAATIHTLTDYREEIAMLVRQHRGRVVDSPGDNLLAEFPTATDGVQCAVEIQGVLKVRNAPLPPERKMEFRIGVHLGEVRVEGERIYGDGVNIAARLEGLAEPGGICISATVHEQVESKLDLVCEDLGEQDVKNIPHPVRAYAVDVPEAPPAAAPGRPIGMVAAGILALVALAAVGWWALREEPAEPVAGRKPPTSLVVLPFDDMSPEGDQEYFAHGMSEELINALTRVPGLDVKGRTTGAVVKRMGLDIPQIGERIDVEAVIEGSVRKGGDRLRVTVQMMAVEDGFHLWSETYDRPLDDVFAIQDEIARSTANALRVQLAGSTRTKPTDLMNAYELYLTGRFYGRQVTKEGYRKSIVRFEQALEADPNFALAHVGLADAHALLFYYGDDRSDETLAKATAAATRALAIDDSLGEAHCSLGFLGLMRWDWAEAEAELQRCLELNPGWADGHRWYSHYLRAQGRVEEMVDEMRRAVELDPLSGVNNSGLGSAYLVVSDYDAAIERFRTVRDRNPDYGGYGGGVHAELAQAYLLKGMESEALEAWLQQDLPEEVKSLLRRAYQEGGTDAFIRKIRELAIAETGKPCTDNALGGARIAAFLGERDAAFECLQEFVDHGVALGTIRVDPFFEDLRADPRFTAILKQMGLDN